MSDYDRDAQFGDWVDADGDCQDTRQEVLARDLRQVVSTDGCRVDSGILDDPYTATTIDFTRGVATSADVQIDHVVATGNAWISGARQLSQTQRVAFYNDPLNLLAVDGPTNGAKGDSAAHQWLPPNTEVHCEYVATQIAVKTKYQLRVTHPEKTAMAAVLTDCAGQPLPTGQPFTTLTTPSSPSARTAPEPTTPAVTAPTTAAAPPRTTRAAPASEPTSEGPYYANCDAARAAGAAPIQRGEPGYRSALDRDGDGTACDN